MRVTENTTDKSDEEPVRTPLTEVRELMAGLQEVWIEASGKDDFVNRVKDPVWQEPEANGYAYLDLCEHAYDQPLPSGIKDTPATRHFLEVLCLYKAVSAFCVQAVRAKNSASAWPHVVDASRSFGLLLGRLTESESSGRSISDIARLGAYAAHAENRAIKAEVFGWLTENRTKFKSRESAAQELAKLQPMKPRTLYLWIEQWEKEHPASRR